ncbi:MAG: acyl carrier protein [Clostridia bacterium]|nr:acyl carrier protein [Clostridia bacterium]
MNIRKDLLDIMTDYTDGRITEVKPDDVLTSDLGLNSFELFDLICLIEEKYDISIPDKILPTLVTVKDVVEYLEENVEG